MNNTEYITVQDLYAYAMQHNLLDARIRICDGMAVSYYPDPRSICQGRYEVVIDVSALQPVEFDELDAWAEIQYAADRRTIHRREYIRTTQARRNAAGPQLTQQTPRAAITSDTPADELPWEIYGYGRKRKRYTR